LDAACKIHTTPRERELSDVTRKAHTDGFSRGFDAGQEAVRRNLEYEIERRVRAELATKSCIHIRETDDQGRQLVTVGFGSGNRGYAYRWNGEGRLKVGDKVLVPAGYFMPRGAPMQVSTVIRLGTDYTGEIATISRRAQEVTM